MGENREIQLETRRKTSAESWRKWGCNTQRQWELGHFWGFGLKTGQEVTVEKQGLDFQTLQRTGLTSSTPGLWEEVYSKGCHLLFLGFRSSPMWILPHIPQLVLLLTWRQQGWTNRGSSASEPTANTKHLTRKWNALTRAGEPGFELLKQPLLVEHISVSSWEMLAISRVCGRAAHPSSLGNLYTGRAKIALSSLSQPFLSHNTKPQGSRHLQSFGGTIIAMKSSPLAVAASPTDLSGLPLSQCCCPELDVSSEFSFQDPSNETWPVRDPCPMKDDDSDGTEFTLLDCVWRSSRETRDGGREKTPSHVPFLIWGEKTIFVDCKQSQ